MMSGGLSLGGGRGISMSARVYWWVQEMVVSSVLSWGGRVTGVLEPRSRHTRTDSSSGQRRTAAEIGPKTHPDLGTCGWLVASSRRGAM